MSRGFDLTIYDFDDETPLIGSGSTFSDDPSHPRPYLLEVTNFAAQEIDFPAGASTIGAVTVSVLDKREDPADQDTGILTAYISEIIGRRARLRRLRGSTWFTVFDGVVNGYEVDEGSIVTYNLFLRDGRDRERAADLFTRNGTFVVYGANGLTGPAEPYGILPSGDALIQPVGANTNAFSLASDPDPADGIYYGFLPFEFIRKGSIGPDGYVAEPIALDELDMPERAEEAWEYRDVSVRWRTGSGAEWKYVDNMPRAWNRSIMDPNQTANVGASRPLIYVGSYDPTDLPSDGQTVQWQVLAQRTSESTPFFWDRGTFGDLLREIYDGEYTRVNPRIRYSTEALDDFAYETPTARFIAYEPEPNMREWVQENIYAPLGYAPSFDPDMRIAPIAWKLPDNEEDLPILDADNVVPAGNWSHDLDSVINAVEITFIRELNRAPDVAPARERPSLKRRLQKWIFGYPYDRPEESTVELEEWEKLAEVEVVRRRINAGSAAIVGTREIKYKPVTVRSIGDSAGLPIGGGTVDEIGDEIARDLAFSVLNRFPFGSVRYVADVLATSEQIQELQIGEWVKVRPDWMPDYQSGRRGARRIMQVVGITDERENYRTVHLMDGAADEDSLPNYCPVGCIIPDGAETFIYGDYIYHVYTEDGSFTTLADSDADEEYDVCVVDILAIGQGGNGGNAAPNPNFGTPAPSIVFVDEDGEEISTALDVQGILAAGGIVARNGGNGGAGGSVSIQNGFPGASGGGGGAGSASFNVVGAAGGQAVSAGGKPGGGGWGSAATFYNYAAAAGSGGSRISAGVNRFGTRVYAGGPGELLDQEEWPGFSLGPGGNSGSVGVLLLPPPLGVPIRIGGGGGQGGVTIAYDRPIKPNRTVQIKVNQQPFTPLFWGAGGNGIVFERDGDGTTIHQLASPGGSGVVVIRELLPLEEGPATIVGGTTADGIQTVVFNSNNDLEVTAAGYIDATLVGGGGGGGSGAGGGGGGGGVVRQRISVPVGMIPVQVGSGGAAGTSGGAGADGTSSRIEDTIASGGGGGGGASSRDGKPGGSGGGGAGGDGLSGAGGLLEGNQGGLGGGYDNVQWGGGGGGASEPGESAARTIGNALGANYEVSTLPYVVDYEVGEVTYSSNTSNFGLQRKPFESGEAAVQVIVRDSATGNRGAFVGLRSTGSPTNRENGYYFRSKALGVHTAGIHLNGALTTNKLTTISPSAPAGVIYPMQFYAGASIQEGWSPYGSGSASDSTHDLKDNGSVHLGVIHFSGASGVIAFREMMIFRTKFLSVSGLPAGWSARVKDAGAVTISSATESGGVAKIDLFQVGAGSANEPVPTAGWFSVEVVDGSSVVQRTSFGAYYPGDELVYTGTAIEYDVDADGAPIRGMLVYEDWKDTRPGPYTGSGGDGRLIGGTRYGAGGGGGSEQNGGPAGVGGLGGGGNGSFASGTPGGNGTTNTGAGGGGSRATTDAGGNGGSGVVIVQVPV